MPKTGSASPCSASSGVINSDTTSEPAHSGSYDAWLDGYGTTHTDTLTQSVTIPAGCTATLTFWLHVDTAETSTTTAYDTGSAYGTQRAGAASEAGAAPLPDDATSSAEPRAEQEPAPATTAFEPAHTRDTYEAVETPSSTAEPAAESSQRHQAFWALVPEERDVVDEIGIPVFRIGPTAWALVIEDRVDVFVVRHEDGRIGYLHDVTGVTRG